jgi:O-antigen/teichoic acid export membrane protein
MAEIFSLLFSVQVYMILPYIFLFVVLMPIRYFQNSLLLAELKQKLNLFSNLIGLIVFIFLCSYFIKYFGFEGVGIILNLSVFSQVLFVYLFNQSGIDFKLIHLLLISTSFLLIYLRTQFEFNYLLFLLSISFAAIIIRKIINTNEQIISKDV